MGLYSYKKKVKMGEKSQKLGVEERKRDGMMHITIRNTANDQTYKLKVPNKINADTVLLQLRSKVRIPETYVLSFGGNVINGDTPLEDAGVGERDLLKLIPNPEGGGKQEYSPTLPKNLWENRLKYEYDVLTEISKKQPVSFNVNKKMMKYTITFNGIGLIKDDGENIKEHYQHTIEVNLNRKFPYPGGLEVKWLSPRNIFLWLIIGTILFLMIVGARDTSRFFESKSLSNLVEDVRSEKVKKIEVIDSKLLATYKDGKVFVLCYQHFHHQQE